MELFIFAAWERTRKAERRLDQALLERTFSMVTQLPH
jgi:hypothetical protein